MFFSMQPTFNEWLCFLNLIEFRLVHCLGINEINYYSGMCTHLVNFIFIAVYILLLSLCAATVNLLNNEGIYKN